MTGRPAVPRSRRAGSAGRAGRITRAGEADAGSAGAAPARPLDVRLLLPALVAWAALAILLPRSAGALRTGALGGAALGVLALLGSLRLKRRARGPARRRRESATAAALRSLALTGCCLAIVLGAAAGHAAVRTSGPVPDWAADRAVARVEAQVLTEPRLVERPAGQGPAQSFVVVRAQLTAVQARGQQAAVRTPVLIFAEPDLVSDLAWRDRFTATGRFGPAEPGADVVATFALVGEPQRVGERGSVLSAAQAARERLQRSVDPLPADARGLIPGLVIGDTSLTPPDLTEAMLATGMTHLSAVSGSNVAIVVGAVLLVCIGVGVPRRWRPAIAVLAILGFVILCRPEPSVLRAGTMGVIGLIGLSTHRRHASLPALAAAIVILLAIDPFHARSYGFVLSCLATLGLVVFARGWGAAIATRLPRGLGWLGYAIAIPLAAQVMCAPIIVLLQDAVQPVSVLTNLLAAPLVAPTTIAGILAAVGGLIWGPLGTVFAWVGAGPAWLIGRIARWGAAIPAGSLDWLPGSRGAWLLTLLTVAAVLCGPWLVWQVRRRPWLGAIAAVLALAVLVPLPGGVRPASDWVIAGCDVGQGDAFLLRSGPDRAVLVDTGPDPEPVAECLRQRGVAELDAVVLTHFHLDHTGGLAGVIDAVPVRAALVSPVPDPDWAARAAIEELRAAGIPVSQAVSGQEWVWGGVSARVVWPRPEPLLTDSAANDNSVVLDVDVGGLRALMLGDIESPAAGPVRRAVAGQSFDVLKVAHHGSADQDPALIRGSGASVAVIGVGADNSYGHPTPSLLDTLEGERISVLRTDQHGWFTVEPGTDGGLLVRIARTARAARTARTVRAGRSRAEPVREAAGRSRRTRATGSRARRRPDRPADRAPPRPPPRPAAGARPAGRASR